MKKKLTHLSLLTFLLSFVWAFGVFAQDDRIIKGKVSSEDEPKGLPGVSIVVKGTTVGTITDFDGNYSIKVPASAQSLVFSFIGYQTKEVEIGGQSEMNVTLSLDVAKLEEVVVIGYGTSTKKELTGAVSAVEGENIEKLNPTRLENALQGQVAGVQITSSSGSPGGAQNIRIRGYSTNGNNNPLVVVDGVPYGTEGLSALNPNDIESINVLKDATAGIYGVRAANGVIIITTKSGRKGQPTKFSFDGYYGVQETTKKLNLLNAREYAILKNEAAAAGGTALPFNNVELGEGTDWQDEVFSTAPIQNYNFSAVGGTDKSNFSIGGSYFDQEGIIGKEKSGFTRYNARLNFSTDLTEKATFKNTLLYTNESRKGLEENGIGSVLFNAINNSPVFSVRNADGEFTYAEGIGDVINPVAQMANTFNEARTNKLVGSVGLDYKIIPGLDFSGRAGYSYAIVKAKSFAPLVYYGTGKAQNTALNADLDPNTVEIAPGVTIPVNNSVTESRSIYFNYNLEAYLNYEKEFGDHVIKGTLGVTTLADMGDVTSGTGFNVPYNSWDFADLSATDGTDYLNNAGSYQYESRLASVFLRGEYKYANKYLFSAIVRRDGSTNFGDNNRFGIFPSFSGAWIFSEEDFLNTDFITFGKLRTSYGISGNDKIGLFRYRGLLNGEGVYPFNDQLITGVAVGALGNPDLQWEQTAQFNVGLDLGLWNDKISVSVDYFVKNTKDLLFTPDVPGILGAYGAGMSPPTVNGGEVKNSGLEVLINYNKTFDNGLNINVGYNVATLKNEVVALYQGQEFLEFGAFGVGGSTATRFEVGQPIGYFFGYKTDGVFQNQEEIASAPSQLDARPGDIRYVDLNNDGVIDFSGDSDKTLIGSAIPDVTMGLNLSVSYKGIDLSTMLYGSFGNDILRNFERQTPLANLLAYKKERWTGEGSTNEHPRLTTGPNRNNVISEYYVEDGSYVRVKNLQIGYTLPSAITEKIGVTRYRIYFAANNLLTFTKYRGFDPDIGSGSPLDAGIDYGFYPQARSFMFGMNLNF